MSQSNSEMSGNAALTRSTVLTELPQGWAISKTMDAIHTSGIIADGDWIESKDQDPNGNVRLIQLADIGDGYFRNKSERFMTSENAIRMNCTFLKSGDDLIARMPDPLGRACIFQCIDQEAFTVVDICLIRLNNDSAIKNQLLMYCLNTPQVRSYIAMQSTGTTRKRITRKKLEALDLPIPPLAEQQQIAAKLDELLAQVDNLKTRLDTIPKILKRFRQSVLAAAVSGKLTEDWRGETTYYDLDGISIPISWKIKQAQEVCCKVQSGSTPRDNPFDQNGTIPFLKVYNIVNQKIDFNYKPQFITKETHDKGSKRSIAYPNDVLMNIVGPPLGKVALLTDQYPEWNLNQAITFFRADDKQLNFQYLYHVLCEGALVRKVMPDTKGSVGQVNISLSQCREALITVPPIEEQTEIVARVEQLFTYAEQIEQRVKDAQARVNHLTQAILAKAFSGELTADWRVQNPELISGENSAAALLARIKAERETVAKPKKTGKKKA